MAKQVPEHKDLLGNLITAETKLAVARGNSLQVCSVVDIHPKMLRVKPIYGHYRGEGHLVYGTQTIVVDGPDVLAYILKGPST